MGALISYELTRRVREKRGLSPVHLFVSGRRAPQLPSPTPPIHTLPQDEFVERLCEFEGTRDEVLQHAELLDFLLPILKADFMLCETYQYLNGEPLDCPLTIFGGTEDVHVSRSDLAAWCQQTRNRCRLLMLPGNHFFLNHSPQRLLRAVAEDLRQLIFFTT
jgi:medium-chain acyl-[acyl-carrier-protein] hydrolase